MRRTWPGTFVLGALVLVLVALSVPIGILARMPVDPLALLGVLVAALGLLIARRQPGNRIGVLPPRWRTVSRAYLALCSVIIAILLGPGAWQVQGTRIAVQNNGQLVNNSGPSGTLGFVLLAAFLAVPVFWASFATRQVLSWRRATGERRCASPLRSRNTTCTT